MRSAKETVEFVRDFLLKQGKCRDAGNDCVYRSETGKKCAIGCLIPDDKYNPHWEGYGFLKLPAWEKGHYPLTAAKNDEMLAVIREAGFDVDQYLAVKLQEIHDSYEPDEWPAKFEALLNEIQA